MRSSLARAAAALLVLQFLHGLAPSEPGQEESGAGLVLGLLGLVASGVALTAVLRGWERAPEVVALVGGAIAAGFVAYHATPWATSVTNPYWGDGSATGLQWLTVVAVLAACGAAVALGLNAARPASGAGSRPLQEVEGNGWVEGASSDVR